MTSCLLPQHQMPPSPAVRSLPRTALFSHMCPAFRCSASPASHCSRSSSSTTNDSSDGSKPEPCRRMILLSAAACIPTAQSITGKATAETLTTSVPAPPATGLATDCPNGTKELIGKPGFRLIYPSDWVVAFVSFCLSRYNPILCRCCCADCPCLHLSTSKS